MTLVHYTAEVKSGLLLELPAEAQALHLKPGDRIQVQLDADPELEEAKPIIDPEREAALALLDSWISEGLAADPETKRQAEEELAEFKRNMNANRTATGDHPVYP
ncbi:MAG: hypothetical protein JWN14_7 [Chthonomonadales bacterium]|nr:hypothetical protein [Chthonomonadales bacterium]